MSRGDRRFVHTLIDGAVATVTLDRRQRHNSLIPELLEELSAAITACESEPGTRVLVLRAAGPSFSTGGDLRGFRKHAKDIEQYANELVGLLHEAIIRLYDCRLPVIAVVDGQVTGGSIGFVLAADIVLVTDRASFAPYYVEAGFSPDGGWTAVLPDVIGRTRASTVQLLNQTITAERALDWGLATAYAEVADLDAAVARLCEQLVDKKAGSVLGTRQLLRPPDLETRLELERRRFVQQIATTEAQSGIDAWLGND